MTQTHQAYLARSPALLRAFHEAGLLRPRHVPLKVGISKAPEDRVKRLNAPLFGGVSLAGVTDWELLDCWPFPTRESARAAEKKVLRFFVRTCGMVHRDIRKPDVWKQSKGMTEIVWVTADLHVESWKWEAMFPKPTSMIRSALAFAAVSGA